MSLLFFILLYYNLVIECVYTILVYSRIYLFIFLILNNHTFSTNKMHVSVVIYMYTKSMSYMCPVCEWIKHDFSLKLFFSLSQKQKCFMFQLFIQYYKVFVTFPSYFIWVFPFYLYHHFSLLHRYHVMLLYTICICLFMWEN